MFFEVFKALKNGLVGFFGGNKGPCGHPRHHTEGFEGFPVISIGPNIKKMKTIHFPKVKF